MKKFFIIAFLILVFMYSSRLEAKELFVRISFSLMHAGHVDDLWRRTTDYYNCSSSKGERTSPGLDYALEFIYMFHTNLGIAVGYGFVSRRLSGSSGHFSSAGTDNPYDEFFLAPEHYSEMNDLYLSCIFSVPGMGNVKANFIGGAGYYFGNIECKTANWDIRQGQWRYFTGLFESNTSTLGYHLGTSIDFYLSDVFILSVEALYRVVNFKKFKTDVVPLAGFGSLFAAYWGEMEHLLSDSTFLYEKQVIPDIEVGDIDYRISNFSYSGFSYRVGIKFKF